MIFPIFFIVEGRIFWILWQWKYCSTGLYGYLCCARLPARCNKGRSSENGALRDTQDTGDFSIIPYNVLNIHSENDRDVVRFEKAHSEHRISRLKMLAAIERDRMDRLRKKLGKIISGDRYPNRSLITKWINIGIMLNFRRDFLHRPICRHLRRWLYNDL